MSLSIKNYDPARMYGARDEESDMNLASGKIIVGNASGVGAEVDMHGDATIANTGAVTIANGAVTYAKRSVVGAATATADGLTTGLILAGETFVTVTSDSATKLVTLPACAAAGVGQTVDLYVKDTGYELVTPASSGDTISTVDSDGTNQLDVPANTLVRLIQVSATGWFAYIVAATTITVVAPDND